MTPSKLKLHKESGDLEIHFPGQPPCVLGSEFLRVHSPSAEVKGHGPGQEVLQWGKKNVRIATLERSGNYAIRLHFDDGHDTGIYSWDYLLELCQQRETLWDNYLEKLHREGRNRDPDVQVVKLWNG
jgi:DUF971 family protein